MASFSHIPRKSKNFRKTNSVSNLRNEWSSAHRSYLCLIFSSGEIVEKLSQDGNVLGWFRSIISNYEHEFLNRSKMRVDKRDGNSINYWWRWKNVPDSFYELGTCRVTCWLYSQWNITTLKTCFRSSEFCSAHIFQKNEKGTDSIVEMIRKILHFRRARSRVLRSVFQNTIKRCSNMQNAERNGLEKKVKYKLLFLLSHSLNIGMSFFECPFRKYSQFLSTMPVDHMFAKKN